MKIICIARNYPEHARELNNELPDQPVFFLKPDSALLLKNQPFFIPEFSEDVHYEAEVVVRINRLGRHIDRKFAHRYYNQVALGIDFTARDIQQMCKQKGLPWEPAKAFDRSAAVSEFIDLQTAGPIQALNFSLNINDKQVQLGDTSEMLFSVDDIIAHVSQFMTLKIGDLIFTGTPPGVGPVNTSDKLTGYLGNREMLNFDIK